MAAGHTTTAQDRPASSRGPQMNESRTTNDRDRIYARDQPMASEVEPTGDATTAAATAARSRRRGPASPEVPQRARSHREPGAQPSPAAVQSRSISNVAGGVANVNSTREESQIINRVVVTDPQIDIAREQERQAEAVPSLDTAASVSIDTSGGGSVQRRQDHSASTGRRKETKFGDYVLGQTLGEGEFGKVKLGWKKDGSVQVAIKLIRLEALGSNPSRLPKIHREISILRELSHPNIVRLHEMVETKAVIGIILEYASGGELFDYILNQRYLKDNSARRLFAQLVSGVGYLHKKGIVHRDLKLENLLLDRNRNIIITDFGFANTFDPREELGEDIEVHLGNRDFIKRMGLDQLKNGHRKGDLMQTSCGSPCYAAPELVVTDSLYTGRKVDVWSCGVILYAMLAGYLPFDDDPANPEGDNINLLYKYIVSTPLTFPEYVTPHARDLLRRILVPDPRKRADLFEVARHSWLSDYAHVVSHVTSSSTTVGEIANTIVKSDQQEAPLLARSASVREPSKLNPANMSPVGGLSHQGRIDTELPAEKTKTTRDPKRRTVQVEYVAPQSQTVRGEGTPTASSPPVVGTSPAVASGSSKTRTRGATEGLESVPRQPAAVSIKPLPPAQAQHQDQSYYGQASTTRTQQRPSNSQQAMAPPSRPPKDLPRSVSDSTGAFAPLPSTTTGRPATGGSISSGTGRLPSRGNSYSQPLAPTVAATNAQGRLAQPKNGKQYNISAPIPQTQPYYTEQSIGSPSTQQYLPDPPTSTQRDNQRGHKRSNTLGNLLGRSGSVFGRPSSQANQEQKSPAEKRYPPTSMKAPISSDSPRQSMESRRSTSFGFGRKSSDLRKNSDLSSQEKPRRFSLLPASFSFKGLTGGGKDQRSSNTLPVSERRPSTMQQAPPSRGQSRPQTMAYSREQSRSNSYRNQQSTAMGYDGQHDDIIQQTGRNGLSSHGGPQTEQLQYSDSTFINREEPLSPLRPPQGQSYLLGESGTPTDSEVSLGFNQRRPIYPQGFNSYEDEPRPSMQQNRKTPGAAVLTKSNRKFADAYEQDSELGHGGGGHHAGTSGAAKRVMDFFRRRGKARAGDDRV